MKPVIKIEWLDSMGVTNSWENIDELISLKPATCTTIGYLFEDTDDYITVAQSYSEQQVLGRITIPKCSIIRTETI